MELEHLTNQEIVGVTQVSSYDEQFDQQYGPYHYEGEVDEQGQACGFGNAGDFDGTYFNNKPHGIGE